jgi:hypothetical protein
LKGCLTLHEQIGDPTLADGILDGPVHNAQRIEMRDDSMRKSRGKPNPYHLTLPRDIHCPILTAVLWAIEKIHSEKV